jgi:hypothetical protein
VTVAEWVTGRTPPPPPELRDRLLGCLGDDGVQPVSALPEVAVSTAERMLRGLLASGDTSRATALDLLVVDSLVTYAFEAAADAPETLGPRAMAAMTQLAQVGAAPR